MDFKDYDFFAWMESERIPEAPPTSKEELSWWYVIPIILIYAVFLSKGLAQ